MDFLFELILDLNTYRTTTNTTTINIFQSQKQLMIVCMYLIALHFFLAALRLSFMANLFWTSGKPFCWANSFALCVETSLARGNSSRTIYKIENGKLVCKHMHQSCKSCVAKLDNPVNCFKFSGVDFYKQTIRT